MKKIMFNDRYGLTHAVLSGRKIQTRRYSCLYKVGEVVAIAQSYKDLGYNPMELDRSPKDWRIVRGTLVLSKGWNNKMFVMADACKHHICITDVRCEPLQNITDEECIKEGVYRDKYNNGYAFETVIDQDGNTLPAMFHKWYTTPRAAFAALIDKVSGKGTWETNKKVYVYDFVLVD